MELDLKTIEKAMKLMTKYQVEELTLSDGTKLVKKVHVAPVVKQKKLPKLSPTAEALLGSSPAINPTNIPNEIQYAASGPPKPNDFNRYKVSNVLRERITTEGNG
jgi:hypothetical protein